MLRKAKKSRKLRGTRYNGRGYNDRNRGAGCRGGRGNAGSGKRADQKKTRLINAKVHNGYKPRSYGFNSLKQRFHKDIKTINLVDLEKFFEYYVKNNVFEKSGDLVKADLRKLGIDKLLGSGRIEHKFEITVDYASEKAVKKVEEAGGKVILLKSSEESSEETSENSSDDSSKDSE